MDKAIRELEEKLAEIEDHMDYLEAQNDIHTKWLDQGKSGLVEAESFARQLRTAIKVLQDG